MKKTSILVVFLFIFAMFTIMPITPAHAGTINNSDEDICDNTCSSLTLVITGVTIGDLLIGGFTYIGGASSNISLPATDDFGDTWVAYHSNFELASLCYGGIDGVTSGCWAGSEYAVATSSGTVTITVDFGTTGYYWAGVIDTTGFDAPGDDPSRYQKTASPKTVIGSDLKCTGDQTTQYGCIWWADDKPQWDDQQLVVDTASVVLCTDTTFAAPVSPYSLIGQATGTASCVAGAMTFGIGTFAEMSNTGCTSIPGGTAGCIAGYNSGSTQNTDGWAGIAVIFPLSIPPPPIPPFTADITNLDCGNCVIAGNGKFYDFQVNVSSLAVDPINFNFDFAVTSLQFNDSIHAVTIYYFYANQSTILASGSGGVVSLGNTRATDVYDSGTDSYSTIVDFFITFNSNVLQASNRGLYLQSCLDELGLFNCMGYNQTSTFNILNVGGLTDTLQSGDCSKVPGGDVFSTLCTYSAGDPSWIATNSTWIDLQSYSTQFSFVVGDNGTGNAQYWQDYGKSSSGAENSANANDWTTDIGFYFFDNTIWIKGPHVVISMQRGDNGTNDEWTVLNTVFYNDNTLVSNQSISAWIEQNPLSQVRVFVDIWYNTVNGSTTWGMRTNAYWLGMNQAVFLGLWGGSWSPRIQNASTSQAYGTLFDHNGDVFSSTQIQCTKVFWNMTRFGAPEVHMGQNNFRITSNQFQIQQFNLAASPSQMGGVVTPIYTAPEVPNLPQAGFFSPLYAAIQSIAGYFVNGLVALGNVIWQQLSIRFPWFTTTISIFTLFIAQYYNFLTFLINTILGLLTWLYSIIGIVFIPINILISAYNYIQITYLPIFGGVPLSAIIEIMVIVFFASAFFDWMSKGDTGKFVELARISWNIVNTIYYGLYWIAKFLVDAIEGLIP